MSQITTTATAANQGLRIRTGVRAGTIKGYVPM